MANGSGALPEMTRRARRSARRRRDSGRQWRLRTTTGGPEITISEEDGVRYLHFGNEWVQGALTLKEPSRLALDYSRHMMAWLLFHDEPQQLLQLGLGAGALTHFAHHYFEQTRVTVVDNSEAVLRAARSQFKLPDDDDRLEVLIADGQWFVTQAHHRGRFEILQVDVFDAEVRGPVLNSQPFYDGCRDVLSEDGILVVNLFGEVASYQDNLQRIARAFAGKVLLMPPVEAGNVIVLASRQGFTLNWPQLYERAAHIETRYGLTATGFVNGLKESVAQGLNPVSTACENTD